jgi:hypothetical protein
MLTAQCFMKSQSLSLTKLNLTVAKPKHKWEQLNVNLARLDNKKL